MSSKEELKAVLNTIADKIGSGTTVIFMNPDGLPILCVPESPFPNELSRVIGGFLGEAISNIRNFLEFGNLGKYEELTIRTSNYIITAYLMRNGILLLLMPQKTANIGLARLVVLPLLHKINSMVKP